MWYPSKGHAIRVARSWAKAQKIESTVRRYWWDPGKNSRKIAESTGRLPPTPTLHKAAKQPMAAKFGEPAAMSPKTEVIPIVRLNANRRPKRSPVDVSHVSITPVYSSTYIRSPRKWRQQVAQCSETMKEAAVWMARTRLLSQVESRT